MDPRRSFTQWLVIALIGVAHGLTVAAEPASRVDARLQADLAVVKEFRPAYPFWQHIFTISDGRIAFGSAQDGRLVVTFPTKGGDWLKDGLWVDPAMSATLGARPFPGAPGRSARRSGAPAGAHHRPACSATRRAVCSSCPTCPSTGRSWASGACIYERFGVPADIGLAQAVLESGLNGTARSRANALGLCQFLRRNWDTLNRLSPEHIEAYNQTTQAPYCAAYLSILATMYGSFIPALSEHHSGGVNVGRTLINGERLGGVTVQQQYLMGSKFAQDLRSIALQRYRDLYRTYGIRSFRYAEMVFGNTITVRRIRDDVPQERIFAMRTPRSDHDRRDHQAHQADGHRSPALQPGAAALGAGERHALPADARAGVRHATSRSGSSRPVTTTPRLSMSSCRSSPACSAGTTRRSSRSCRDSVAASRPPTPKRAG